MNEAIKELIELESKQGSDFVSQSLGYYTKEASEAGLSEEEFLTLRMMVSNEEGIIQRHLFSGTVASRLEEKLCDYLDRAISKLPIEDTTPIVYRVENTSIIKACQKGTVIKYPGYLTTSKSPCLGFEENVYIMVHLAGRTKARSIYRVYEIAPFAPEFQVEFPRNTEFLVNDYRFEGNTTVIELIEQPDYPLPVERLSPNVTEFFSLIKSIDIQEAIDKGLNPLIRLAVSVDGKNINAHCSPEGFVRFSPTYAQAMWNLAYVAVVLSDSLICSEMLQEQCNTNLQKVCEEIDKARCDDYRARYLKALNDAIPVDDMLVLVNLYINNSTLPSDDKMLSSLPVDGEFERRINGVYRAGMGWVLLHELTHFNNDHFDRNESEQRRDLEMEADRVAFEGILSLENPKERNTGIIGAICAQLLGFYMNPYMKPSANYYSSDIRLFALYDMIESDKRSASIIIANVLKRWLERFHHTTVDIVIDQEEMSLGEIRNIIKDIRS